MSELQKITGRLAKLSYGRIDPARDWFVLLGISAVAFLSILVWNIWTFDVVANGGTIGRSATQGAPLVSQSSLDSIHAVFANRAAQEAQYETGTILFADPSSATTASTSP